MREKFFFFFFFFLRYLHVYTPRPRGPRFSASRVWRIFWLGARRCRLPLVAARSCEFGFWDWLPCGAMPACGAAGAVAAASRKANAQDGGKCSGSAPPRSVSRLSGAAELGSLDDLRLETPPPRVMGPSQRIYGGASLMGLRPHDEPRQAAIRLCEWPQFDQIVLAAIVAN
eukprot:69645-Prymnesium_polylepis.1